MDKCYLVSSYGYESLRNEFPIWVALIIPVQIWSGLLPIRTMIVEPCPWRKNMLYNSDIGSIKIKMHHGVVRNMIDVRFIPDLLKNHFSLSALDFSCWNIITENRYLMVVWFMIVRDGISHINLDFFVGFTITRNVEKKLLQAYHII